MLILPGTELYRETLENSIHFWLNHPSVKTGLNYCRDPDTGLFKPLDRKDTIEYVYGGEYDSLDSPEAEEYE
jgi:hypothetical protein